VIRSQKKLGELFMDKGLLTPEQLNAAIEEQKRTKEFLGTILVRKNQVKERDLLAMLAEQFDIQLVSLKNRYIDWKLVKDFSASLILNHRCFPLNRDRFSVTVAIANPLDAWALKRAEEEAKGLKLKLVLVSGSDMDGVILRYKQYMRSDLSRKFE
jgi:type IV pilus assembly protein PilB